jgi:hypothetical protein
VQQHERSLSRIVGISLFARYASATAFADTPRTIEIGEPNDPSGIPAARSAQLLAGRSVEARLTRL